MVYYLALFLLIWMMIYSAVNVLRYYKICRNYKNTVFASVVSSRVHEPENKKQKQKEKTLDVLLEYVIDGKKGQTEVNVPSEHADRFPPSELVCMRYYVAGNGTVHMVSDTDAVKGLLYGYTAAFVAEVAAFVVIWLMLI